MTDKQRDAIERHGRNLLAMFPNATERDPVRLCRKLRRLEVKGHAFAVRRCNEDVPPGEVDATRARILLPVLRLLGTDAGRVWLNGDPRGYALKVDLRDGECLHTDWGGYGIIAPEIGPDGN